ncbi:MAG TPA: FKBP-type peptidyl-prolyl cis-trans isomerase [Gemmata sp.]|nr:FKBP-type peptidyl-prolyl cis-trans isomerase [Gemmata sp.]
MQTTQIGDSILVHYVKRYSDGAVRSSRARGGEPLRVTVGTPHPRLPGVGAELVGLAPGGSVTVAVPAGKAFGASDTTRVRRVNLDRFDGEQILSPGRRARLQLRRGGVRVVRVVGVRGRTVTIDTNHPRCGQSVEVDVEIVSVGVHEADVGFWRL